MHNSYLHLHYSPFLQTALQYPLQIYKHAAATYTY